MGYVSQVTYGAIGYGAYDFLRYLVDLFYYVARMAIGYAIVVTRIDGSLLGLLCLDAQ